MAACCCSSLLLRLDTRLIQHTMNTHRRENMCLCGDVPPWLSNATWPNAANTSLGVPCDSAPLVCSPVLPPAWYADNGPLLELKAALAAGQNPDSLYSWTEYRPACTSVNATGDCGLCDWQDACGRVRAADGLLLCNYRFVTCRARRVVGIHLGKKVGDGSAGGGLYFFLPVCLHTSLPAALLTGLQPALLALCCSNP